MHTSVCICMPGEYPGATNGVSGTVTVKDDGSKLVLDYSLVGLEKDVFGGRISGDVV